MTPYQLAAYESPCLTAEDTVRKKFQHNEHHPSLVVSVILTLNIGLE